MAQILPITNYYHIADYGFPKIDTDHISQGVDTGINIHNRTVKSFNCSVMMLNSVAKCDTSNINVQEI